jgi:hypothetical protein
VLAQRFSARELQCDCGPSKVSMIDWSSIARLQSL